MKRREVAELLVVTHAVTDSGAREPATDFVAEDGPSLHHDCPRHRGELGRRFELAVRVYRSAESAVDRGPRPERRHLLGFRRRVAGFRQVIEGDGIRTHDLRIKSPLLYQLSYAFQLSR